MRKRHLTYLTIALVFLSAFFMLALLPANGWTACTVAGAADTDCDGLTDTEELGGITTPGISPETFQPCTGAEDRTTCLDVQTPDIFVVIEKASTVPCTGAAGEDPASCTRMPDAPEYISNLGVAAHVLGTQAVADLNGRYVTGNQRALLVTEDRRCTEGAVGASVKWGSPNKGDGRSIIYTCRIENYVRNSCGSKTCMEVHTGVTGVENVIDVYVQHTLIHEMFHNMRGTPRDVDQDGVDEDTYVANGNHYYAASDPAYSTVMEPSVTWKRGGAIRFFIPVAFTESDIKQAGNIYEQ